jgi:hypothetical protein
MAKSSVIASWAHLGTAPPKLVGRDSVEPFQRLKFSVSGLKQGQGLNLESLNLGLLSGS